VPNQIKRWDKAGGKVLAGLVRRREAESLLFEGKEWQDV
jgi:GH24 family phage-related lysozyme (muramidase)